MKKNGFSLVELLAVIIVLGIVSTIVITVTNDIKKDSSEKAFQATAKNILKAAQDYHAKNDYKGFPEGGLDILSKQLDIKIPKEYVSGTVYYANDLGVFFLDNFSNGTYCASGTNDELEVIEASTCVRGNPNE